MAGLINWKKVAIPGSNPDTDHVYVGIDTVDELLYIKNNSGLITKALTLAQLASTLSDYDTSAIVDTKISNAINALINGAGSALDTLNELAAALGNDPDFATTITNMIGDHIANVANPHNTTAAQVGAYTVAQADTEISSKINDHKNELDPHPQYETSTEAQAKVDAHANLTNNPHSTTKTQVGLGNVPNVDATNPLNIVQTASFRFVSDTEKATWSAKEPAIAAGVATQYYRGDKTFQTLDKNAVGLPNVDNTSDANKPVSSAQQVALNAKADKTTTINAGTGLTGGGDLSANRTLALAASGVTPGTYVKPVMTVDVQGRVTSIREAYKAYIENNTDASTNLATNQTYTTLNVDVPVDGDYKIDWSAIFRMASTTVSPVIDVLLDGVGIYSPKAAVTEEISDASTNERIKRSGFVVKNLTAGAHTITLVYRSESGGSTITIHYGNLLCTEL